MSPMEHVLTWILFTPTVGALLLGLLPNRPRVQRWAALVISLIPLALTLWVWANFDFARAGEFQFRVRLPWYDAIGAAYHVGIDGLSLVLVLLTTLLVPLAILASFSVQERVRAYMMLFLMLETGMLGVFLVLDLLLFFVFWEVGLVPMFFLILLWGSPKGERELWPGFKLQARTYAAMKFMVYTMAGSLGLLLALQMLGLVTGTFDYLEVLQRWPTLTGQYLPNIPWRVPLSTAKALAFWAFVVAFALKVPVWPFHTWLPDAHTEAPTAGSMILAGVLLKLGAYGFLRFVLPLYPAESRQYAGVLAFLAMMAVVLGALAAWGQWDFKRLVAYSSINHMGLVVLAIAAAAAAANSPHAVQALNGAVLQMFNHGLTAAGMFFLVGVLYDRTHTRDLRQFGGLFAVVPVYGGFVVLTAMASLGLPGLNNFVSEFLILSGAWPVLPFFTAVSLVGVLLAGAYTLKGIKYALFSPLQERWQDLKDMTPREVVVIVPLAALMLLLGVWPLALLDVIHRSMLALLRLLVG